MPAPRPRKGQPIKADDIQYLVNTAAKSLQAASDSITTAAGTLQASRREYRIAVAELIDTKWTAKVVGTRLFLYCPGKLLGFSHEGGWDVPRGDEAIIGVWRPWPTEAQNGDEVAVSVPRLHVYYDPASQRWIALDDYEQFIECVLDESLYACNNSQATTTNGETITVSDDFGVVGAWRWALQDERGYYAPAGTPALCYWLGDRRHWTLFFLKHCPLSSSSSEPPSSSSVSDSASSQSSESSQPSSSGSSAPSESSISQSQPPSESWSGSDKSSAIVPASWSPTGYVALFIHEMPEVRFDDVMVVTVPQCSQILDIDPRFVEVCERGSLEVCGIVADQPVLIGARAIGDKILIKVADDNPEASMRLVIRLTGIRRGFAGKRFPRRTREQFLANEAFINSAYPSDPRAE